MLTTVLTSAEPDDSFPVDSSPVIVGPSTRVVAASSDSESQEGETDPPPIEKPVDRFVFDGIFLVCGRGVRKLFLLL